MNYVPGEKGDRGIWVSRNKHSRLKPHTGTLVDIKKIAASSEIELPAVRTQNLLVSTSPQHMPIWCLEQPQVRTPVSTQIQLPLEALARPYTFTACWSSRSHFHSSTPLFIEKVRLGERETPKADICSSPENCHLLPPIKKKSRPIMKKATIAIERHKQEEQQQPMKLLCQQDFPYRLCSVKHRPRKLRKLFQKRDMCKVTKKEKQKSCKEKESKQPSSSLFAESESLCGWEVADAEEDDSEETAYFKM
ncbi:uncharacterized protein LOC135353219 [Latimeria chalumnae]|uniref:uncharacterized protein LOC135353219 n=1 Tax=Latimeria chalumnae TaxID=7897 RepID=UPI00313EBCDE